MHAQLKTHLLKLKKNYININTGIACTAENTLAEVEEKLYQMYNEYRNTNNILMHKGNIALRFKKIKENKIKNGDKIIIDIPQ